MVRRRPDMLFTLFILALVALAVYTSRNWSFGTRLFPWAIGIPVLGLSLVQLGLDLFQTRSNSASDNKVEVMDVPVDRSVPLQEVLRRSANIFGWIFGLLAAVWLVGFRIAVPIFVFINIKFQGRERWLISLAITGGFIVFLLIVFDYVLHVLWPRPAILDWLPLTTF